MSDYEAILVYAGFALFVFAIGMIWRYHRDKITKRFHLLNYYSKHDDPKGPHLPV
jgi:hypothetical protein